MTNSPFKILFENDEFIAIDKPAGLSFHNDSETDGVATQLNQMLSSKVLPVHRLDKMTSGILLFAKTQQAAAELTSLF